MPRMRSRWIPGGSATRKLSAEANWLPKPTCYEKTTETVRWKVSPWRRCHLSKGASYPQIPPTRQKFRRALVVGRKIHLSHRPGRTDPLQNSDHVIAEVVELFSTAT